MTYLIALIIAVALGAIIALLSFVNIGSGFSGQSAAAKAQQFLSIASQIQIGMSAYNITKGTSAYVAGDATATIDNLLTENWLKDRPTALKGTNLGATDLNNKWIFMGASDPADQGTHDLTVEVCSKINEYYNVDMSTVSIPSAGSPSIFFAEALQNANYRGGCFSNEGIALAIIE